MSSTDKQLLLRWGILCSGRISHDFCSALQALPTSQHKIRGIGARNLESARQFAASFGIEKFYGSYEELVKDPEVDVIYIGAIGPQHLPLAKLGLDHGKHVLCEKPLCINSKEVKQLVQYARAKKLFLMEGIWSRCFPSYLKLKEELAKGSIGDVKQVFVSLSLPLGEDFDRTGLKEIGRSSLQDVGIYCVQLATLVFGSAERPLKILSGGHLNAGGVDESSSTTLIYSNGRTATFLSHYSVDLPAEGLIFGTAGRIRLPFPFWSATQLETPTQTYEFPLPKPGTLGRNFNFPNSIGLSYEAEEVRQCILNGKTESPLMTLDESILIAEIMDSIRTQIGVVFPQD